MRYTNGNYEAFARSRKPKDVEKKQAYIVGGGLAGLAAAVFLIRDGHMEGKKIHVLEELSLSGGSLDGKLFLMMALSLEAVVKWKIILNVYGIYSVRFHHWR